MKLNLVHFDPKHDTIEGIYLNNKLVYGGDILHNSIRQYIQGFLKGLSVAGIDWKVDHHYTKSMQKPADYFTAIDFNKEDR